MGAGVVDLTDALEGETGAVVRGPLAGVRGRSGLGLETTAVVAATPAAVMLASGRGEAGQGGWGGEDVGDGV